MLWKLSYFSEGVPIQAIVAATLRLLLPCIMPFQLCFHFLHQVRFPFWLPTTLFLLFPMIFHLFFPMSFLIALSLLTFFISFFFSRSASSKPDPISPYLKKKKKEKYLWWIPTFSPCLQRTTKTKILCRYILQNLTGFH